MRTMQRIYGREVTQAIIAKFITEADAVSGGKCAPEAIAVMSALAMERFKHRSMASVLMAIRDGISYSDDDGKVYGVITWPKLALWLDRHEQAILRMAEDEAASRKEAPGNLDGRYMDAMERHDPARRLEQKDRLIDQLRRKLETKKP